LPPCADADDCLHGTTWLVKVLNPTDSHSWRWIGFHDRALNPPLRDTDDAVRQRCRELCSMIERTTPPSLLTASAFNR
jgi:hypothetical protein